ncbi:32123_t:CDS:2 [Racocetra persica]|uniref:32123_t:CDS:1 n=1 Tax=Racocetra persica TaxID=160502 RepID=A0ACA9R210_9GLOM|nr:32123_t:CDS:2 [Racocetra persica]
MAGAATPGLRKTALDGTGGTPAADMDNHNGDIRVTISGTNYDGYAAIIALNDKNTARDTAWVNAFKAAAQPAGAYDAMADPDILAYRKNNNNHEITAVQGATARNNG